MFNMDRQDRRPNERSLSLPLFLGVGSLFVSIALSLSVGPGAHEVWSAFKIIIRSGLPAFLSVSCPSTALEVFSCTSHLSPL